MFDQNVYNVIISQCKMILLLHSGMKCGGGCFFKECKAFIFIYLFYLDLYHSSHFFKIINLMLRCFYIISAGPKSGAGSLGGGKSTKHVPGLRGSSALHAHQRGRLLERMERLCQLHNSKQQRCTHLLPI